MHIADNAFKNLTMSASYEGKEPSFLPYLYHPTVYRLSKFFRGYSGKIYVTQLLST